jgi:N-methylhydantoinase A
MIIGLDVGGTHTDVVLLDDCGLVREIKVPTDSENLFKTVLICLERITEGVDDSKIRRVVLSTTLTTNAIVQGKTAPVGMIVTAGPGIDPENFRTPGEYVCVKGAMDNRGREFTPIDPEEIESAAKGFLEKGITIVGVVGKFSVRNPSHETAIAKVLGDRFERIFLGHQVSGNLNYPRRIATTYLNAAVYPIHLQFYNAVRRSLEQKGITLPIRILKADGGNMKFESSIDFPAQTILSGPAASIMGAIAFADPSQETLVLDIGGTTTDMAILINSVPLLDPQGIELMGYKTLIRSLETFSIGIGGDSWVRVQDGKLRIGPNRLGPAMAFGGSTPTPTDAIITLGLLDSGDPDRAREGIQSIADSLGISLKEAASQIFDTACLAIIDHAGRMIDHINSKPVYTVHELWEGLVVRPKKMLILGGPAPYFAERLHQMTDFDVKVVPRWGVANAIGAALARTTSEVTLFADTEQEVMTAPEENFSQKIDRHFSHDKAVETAFQLLRDKAVGLGANPDHLNMEIHEDLEFNMVRGFYTSGRNMRIKVQVKPGLIARYKPIIDALRADMAC